MVGFEDRGEFLCQLLKKRSDLQTTYTACISGPTNHFHTQFCLMIICSYAFFPPIQFNVIVKRFFVLVTNMVYLTALCKRFGQSSPDSSIIRTPTGAFGPSPLAECPHRKPLALMQAQFSIGSVWLMGKLFVADYSE